MRISVCTTNYNCGHALDQHLASVYEALAGLDFEYIVVDNCSIDRSLIILRAWASRHANMTVLSRRCTMGEGRQIAFRYSEGSHILVLDTDVVYSDLLRRLVDAYFVKFFHLSVQAVFCGIFPREQWTRAGGRRSLNTNEDVDLWLRISRLGTMRWYPVFLGENLKEPEAWGISDHLSRRYSRRERVLRLVRREWDLQKTRGIQRIDLQKIIEANLIDFQLGPSVGRWPQHRVRVSRMDHLLGFARELKQAMVLP